MLLQAYKYNDRWSGKEGVYKLNPIISRSKGIQKLWGQDDTGYDIRIVKANNWIGCKEHRKMEEKNNCER